MANIKSAKKRACRAEKRRLINLSRKSSIKTVVKKLLSAIKENEAVDIVQGKFRDAESKIARAKRKIMHPNTAARKVSSLAKKVSSYVKQQQA